VYFHQGRTTAINHTHFYRKWMIFIHHCNGCAKDHHTSFTHFTLNIICVNQLENMNFTYEISRIHNNHNNQVFLSTKNWTTAGITLTRKFTECVRQFMCHLSHSSISVVLPITHTHTPSHLFRGLPTGFYNYSIELQNDSFCSMEKIKRHF